MLIFKYHLLSYLTLLNVLILEQLYGLLLILQHFKKTVLQD